MMNEYELEQIYTQYFHKLYNYAYYRTLNKDAAEDIVSETFLRLVEKSHLYDHKKGSFSSWIYAVCKNCISDHFRKNPLICSLDDNAKDASYDDKELASVENECKKKLYIALSLLTERERLLFYYKYYLGKTNRKIAKILDVPESTVGTELYRARKRIKEKTKIEFE